MDTEALLLTLRLAALTTAILLAVAIPLGSWIGLSRTPVRFIAEALVALPLILPPTVLGFYLLVQLGPTTALGRVVIRTLGHTLAFTFPGLVVGSILYSLPFAVQPIVSGLRAVDPAYLDAARTLGAGPVRRLFGVALPLAKGSLLAAAVLTFTHTVGEFGVVLMLGGNIPGRTRTLSIALFDLVENGDFASANRLSLWLLAGSALALLVLYAQPLLQRERRPQA